MLVSFDKALKKLKADEIVAIPTETVYGLAASIESEVALKKIFLVKKRPFFDPLIVHGHSISSFEAVARPLTQIENLLAKSFWPGPMTLILEKNKNLNALITSGLETVGVRVPDHPLTLSILEKLNVPLAAPSANLFGHTSPTTAEHVEKEFEGQVAVLDGGPSAGGIESTVLRCKENEIVIYRPGLLTPKQIKKILNKNNINLTIRIEESPVAPGHLKHHYEPAIPLVLLDTDEQKMSAMSFSAHTNKSTFNTIEHEEYKKKISQKFDLKIYEPHELVLNEHPAIAARELYSQMRELSSKHPKGFMYVIKKPEHKKEDLWLALFNRIEKAARLILQTYK